MRKALLQYCDYTADGIQPIGDNTKPFLRWAGSKRQIIRHLAKYWSPTAYRRYIEPFAGSACLFFNLAPHDAILGDINKELISTYSEIKNNPSSVIEQLSFFEKSKEQFYQLRSINPSSLSSSQQAARFIYLNRFCYGGLYRTNTKGNFNVPYGGTQCGDLPTPEALAACSKILKNAELLCRDFEETLKGTRLGDFVYLDPPYSVDRQRVFKEYNPRVFKKTDIIRLRVCLDRLNSIGVHFVVTYADCEEANILSRDYYIETVAVTRNIARSASNRKKITEIVMSNISK